MDLKNYQNPDLKEQDQYILKNYIIPKKKSNYE